jgi:hypothetical protein
LSSFIRVSSVFDPWLFPQAMNRRGRGVTPRKRASLCFSANSAVKSGELSACRWDTFRRAFVFPCGSGDFLVILRLRPQAALGLSWFSLFLVAAEGRAAGFAFFLVAAELSRAALGRGLYGGLGKTL